MRRLFLGPMMAASLMFTILVLLAQMIGPLLPDQGQLAYMSIKISGNNGVNLMDLARGFSHPLVMDPGPPSIPAWSPDGQHIVFVTNRFNPLQMPIPLQLALIDADGRNLRQLTHSLSIKWRPSWSPDGRRLAYFAEVRSTAVLDVYMLSLDTGEEIRLSPPRGEQQVPYIWHGHLIWSPDGRYVYGFSSHGTGTDLQQLRMDTHQPGTIEPVDQDDILVAAGQQGLFSIVGPPVPAPDGGWLAFTGESDSGQGLYILDVGGDSLRQVTDQGQPANPTWSVDGRYILYQDASTLVKRLCMIAVDGDKPICPTRYPNAYDLRPET